MKFLESSRARAGRRRRDATAGTFRAFIRGTRESRLGETISSAVTFTGALPPIVFIQAGSHRSLGCSIPRPARQVRLHVTRAL
jgi:hypothetical protein